MRKIYVSSIAFNYLHIDEILKVCYENEVNLEFSSGLPYLDEMEDIFLNYPHPKLVHNYFPAHEIPFVLNLASGNNAIRQKSIKHCIQGLRLTKNADAPFFAAHAGFCIDPNPNDLGKKLVYKERILDKEYHWKLFIESIGTILIEAKRLNVDFYIENNVIAKFNIDNLGQNPLLCCNYRELKRLTSEFQEDHFGILLDTAHLKVSSNTLGFNLNEAVKNLESEIKAIHHSDNNGEIDSNEPITNDYWFLKFIPYFKNLIQVLEVKNQTIIRINDQKEILLKNT